MPYGLILFTVFLVLKLTRVISWSWWWVASPLILWFLCIIGFSTWAVLTTRDRPNR